MLNVGGGAKSYPISAHYSGWRHDLLDIDPACNPDILMDARSLATLPGGTYDAVYCSHNLEHYHRHDAIKVVQGFIHVLKPDGFVEIHVPDVQMVMRHAIANNLDIDDVLYVARAGPILVRDVIYGYHVEIERSNNDFYGHRTGFSPKSLQAFLFSLGFAAGNVSSPPFRPDPTHHAFAMQALMFKQLPTPEQTKLLGLTASR